MNAYCIVHVRPQPTITVQEDMYMLFHIENEPQGYVWTCIPRPLDDLCARPQWVQGGEEESSEMITLRKSKRHAPAVYTHSIKKLPYVVRAPRFVGHDLRVYELEEGNRILPKQYFHVSSGGDTSKRYHFLRSDIRETIQKSVQSPKIDSVPTIPPHILRIFMDSAIEKKEECPITMEPFTRETIACTPCGHLFSRPALERAIASTHKCPTCRGEVKKIQSWN